MNDAQIAAAPRASSPDAIADLGPAVGYGVFVLVVGRTALSWNGDRRAPFAYRAGQARAPDRP